MAATTDKAIETLATLISNVSEKSAKKIVNEELSKALESLKIQSNNIAPRSIKNIHFDDGSINPNKIQNIDAYIAAHNSACQKLVTPRKIELSGEVQGSVFFDGSQDVAIQTAVSRITNSEMEELLK